MATSAEHIAATSNNRDRQQQRKPRPPLCIERWRRSLEIRHGAQSAITGLFRVRRSIVVDTGVDADGDELPRVGVDHDGEDAGL